MFTAAEAIAELDNAIRLTGQAVTLVRLVPNGSPVSAPMRGFVRGYKPDELSNGVQQGDSLVVISPTSLTGTGFEDTPPAANNKADIAGRRRNIEAVEPVYFDDVLVRIKLQVRG